MDTLQNELQAEYPALSIQILGVNENGQEQGNPLAVAGKDLPFLQDEDANHDGESDAWAKWEAEWRDFVVLNAQMERVGVFNLTTYDLGQSVNYSAAKQILVGVAQGKAFWQNSADRLDVSGDGQITPVDDVLRLINELNVPTITIAGRLPLPMPPHQPAPYFDVNGDGFLSAASDILPVINYFNQSAGEGEGSENTGAAEDQVLSLPNAVPSWSTTDEFDIESDHAASSQSPRIPSSAGVESNGDSTLESTNTAVRDHRHAAFARAWDEHPAELMEFLASPFRLMDGVSD